MAKETVVMGVSVEGNDLTENPEKIFNLADHIIKVATVIDMTPMELGMALGLVQDELLEVFHVIPVSEKLKTYIESMEVVK